MPPKPPNAGAPRQASVRQLLAKRLRSAHMACAEGWAYREATILHSPSAQGVKSANTQIMREFARASLVASLQSGAGEKAAPASASRSAAEEPSSDPAGGEAGGSQGPHSEHSAADKGAGRDDGTVGGALQRREMLCAKAQLVKGKRKGEEAVREPRMGATEADQCGWRA